MAEQGYTQPIQQKVKVLGQGALGYVLCRNRSNGNRKFHF